MTAVESHRAHGTYVKYVVERCRCDDCRRANRDYEQQRARRVEPAYVGADRARQHMKYLAENGVGLKTVAKRSGVSTGALSKLMFGDYLRGTAPSRRIRRETEQRILAVTVNDAAGGSREPAGPTWAVVDRLLERGWTKMGIARAIGQGGPGLQLGTDVLTRGNARAVRALLAQPVPTRFDSWGNEREVPEFEDVEEPPDPVQIDLAPIPAGMDLSWRARSTCRRPEIPTYIFFPARGDLETLNAAREVCARCPVVEECLDFALVLGEKHGVWGGKAEHERQRLRRARRAA